MRRAREGPRRRDHNGGAHSEEPWDVQPQPGDRMEGQGGARGAKEIVQGRKSAGVLECNRSTSEKTA
jgi:hypothetical protein